MVFIRASRLYGNEAIVVFGGYECTTSTKSAEQKRRATKSSSRDIMFDESMQTVTTQSAFLIETDRTVAPDSLLNMVSCGCKPDGCSNMTCSCNKLGLFCTSMCSKCSGQTCNNTTPSLLNVDDEYMVPSSVVISRDALCKECFYWTFETEIHHTIMKANLFKPGEYIAIAASGGKDSTVLAHIMKLLNERHNYQLKLVLLSIDEGISGYRDDSLETVKRNQEQYELPLKILSYEDLYGWTMDAIVKKVGKKSNCTFCGVFRRQALDRGAIILGVDKIVTGHNADDIAETVIMNVLRGDIARLQRCTAITTGTDGALPRCKPFKYTYEKEIVMYAYLKKLDYFSTECIYSPNAYRGYAREFLKNLEAIRSTSIIDIIHSGECMSVKGGTKMPTQGVCKQCGYISSQDICKACVLLEGLNKGLPRLGIGKTSKVKKSEGHTHKRSCQSLLCSGFKTIY
ncbi:Cytoplasmic tRNA 2-thiolation protein 1 [Nymphon striatum]|nr:Cytoplasmic tRNA 2-thiolation protein 1 [Nymphon striatum]